MAKSKTGTREWAQQTVNINQRGCENNCRYCYARASAVRFKQCTADDWATPVIKTDAVTKRYRKRRGVTMFPSTHDITPQNLEECTNVLYQLLSADNDVLIVTKPVWKCIQEICNTLDHYREQIVFRFTIGSLNDSVLRFWEPGAPGFPERVACLTHAYQRGFKTSVSSEPYLDDRMPELYEAVRPLVTECIWIGILREFTRRVDISGMSDSEMKTFVDPLKEAQSDEAVLNLHDRLNNKPLVRWKDSIREIVARSAATRTNGRKT